MEEVKQQRAYVERLDGEYAWVNMLRHEACSKCGGCAAALSSKEFKVRALNRLGAKPGDYVELSLVGDTFMKATMIMYGVPLLALVLGLIVPYFLGVKEGLCFLIGLAATAVSYLGIRAYSNKLPKVNAYTPVIEKYYYTEGELNGAFPVPGRTE